MDTTTFLQTHRVFSLDEAVEALAPSGGRKATLERIKYAVSRGKLKKLARGVYATVPAGLNPAEFDPDGFLAAAALRPDAIFSHHSALELLGASHSEWRLFSAYSSHRSRSFQLGGLELRFLAHPVSLLRKELVTLGTRSVQRLDRQLRTTSPERTLVDGFRQPALVGGLSEHVESSAGFPVLELPLLFDLLEAYEQKVLWAAVGWFLETYRSVFYVSDQDLAAIEREVPKSPQYLASDQRGGVMAHRWNLIVPEYLVQGREPDES